jgi:hypothetical protein
MGRSNFWQLLFNTIGFPTIIATILGVPAMIAFVATVWHTLSWSHQVIAAIMAGIIIIAITIFIYGRVRKQLYIIPTILNQMHTRSYELATQLSPNFDDKESIESLSLLHIDPTELLSLVSSVTTIDQMKEVVPGLLEMAALQTEKAKEEKETPQRIFQFFYDKVGLKKALEKDKNYQHLKQQLDKVWVRN